MFKNILFITLMVFGSAYATPNQQGTSLPTLKPTENQSEAAMWSRHFLSRFHYKKEPLDNAMSEKIFDRYLESLDGDRLFFLASDIEKFNPLRNELDDAIADKNLLAPFSIFNVYTKRVTERTAYARELLKGKLDFAQDETYTYERDDKTPWAKDEKELNDQWRKRVKNDWLRLKLAGKEESKIRETLDKRYANFLERMKELNSEDVFQTFMNAYAMSIEPHTNYLGPRASENFDIAMKLSLEGIGAVLQRDDEYTTIREIVPGGPAALSGKLKAGDRIIAVGQGASGTMEDVLGWRLDDVVQKVRGPKDSVVRLDILPVDAGPDTKPVHLSLTRKKVSIEESAAKSSIMEIPDGNAKRRIGVITLPGFYQDFEARRKGDKNYKSATRDVEKLLTEFKKQDLDGVLIDLRNNGGGSLNEATELTGLFIDTGPVVQVRNAQGQIDVEADRYQGMAWQGPLAVLINRNSASASEIFAAAIQDYGRGIIIGEPSYGKGTVQNLLSLDQVAQKDKSTYGELKMTIAQFFRISGGTTQLRGVTPDIHFPITIDFDQNGEQAFKNALPWTSIPAADYKTMANLKGLIPMLETRHETRVAKLSDWQALQDDIAEFRKLRKETTISLKEDVRKKERDEQEARRVARQKTSVDDAESTLKGASQVDDGLQADERGLKIELARQKEQEKAKDILLEESAHILADEIGLIKADTKLAAQVLPHLSSRIEEAME